MLSKETRESGAVVACPLDRPHPSSRRVPVCETQRLRVTAGLSPDRPLRDYRSAGRCHDRQHVLIAVSVDADHVIQFVCKHPDRSSLRRVRYAGLEQGNRAAGL